MATELPFHAVNPALDSMDETMIHVSDRSVVRFDPIRSWSTNGAAIGRYSRIMAEAEVRCRLGHKALRPPVNLYYYERKIRTLPCN